MGGFFLAESLTKWNLHKRFAFFVIKFFGKSSNGIIVGFMIATASLSMWISNTATSIMMATIGVSVIQTLSERQLCSEVQSKTFAKALMLCIAYSASIGGITTLIGTPPNLIFVNFVQENLNETVSMISWMIKAVPFVITLLILTWLAIYYLFPSIRKIPVSVIREKMKVESSELKKLELHELTIIGIFFAAAALWIFRLPITNYFNIQLTDSIIAIGASLMLFCIPVSIHNKSFLLDWESARKIPWGILLMVD